MKSTTPIALAQALFLVAASAAAQEADEAAPVAASEPDGELPLGDGPAAAPAGVRHLPQHQLDASEDARLRFSVPDAATVGELVVRWRALDGDGPVHDVSAVRASDGWEADIAAAELPRAGMAYWVVRRTPDGEQPVFASEDAPHPAHVREPDVVGYERAELERRGGRRSRVAARGEYVQLGTRTTEDAAGTHRERSDYYELEASYAYAFFVVVDEIRLALGRMRAHVHNVDAPDESQGTLGLDYGTAQITWRAHDILRFRTGVLFGISHDGFEVGGLLDVIIGQREGTNLTFGVEGATTLGATGRARLGWLTIPSVPMGATIEVTTWPLAGDGGLRLLYDIAYELYPGAFLRAEAGYRGWDSTTGGLSAGGELALAF